eukprot:2249580-Prymnesium_polylepis.2
MPRLEARDRERGAASASLAPALYTRAHVKTASGADTVVGVRRHPDDPRGQVVAVQQNLIRCAFPFWPVLLALVVADDRAARPLRRAHPALDRLPQVEANSDGGEHGQALGLVHWSGQPTLHLLGCQLAIPHEANDQALRSPMTNQISVPPAPSPRSRVILAFVFNT